MQEYVINYSDSIFVKTHDMAVLAMQEPLWGNYRLKDFLYLTYNFVRFNKLYICYRVEEIEGKEDKIEKVHYPVGYLAHASLSPSQAHYYINNKEQFPMEFHLDKPKGSVVQEWVTEIYTQNKGSFEASRVVNMLLTKYYNEVVSVKNPPFVYGLRADKDFIPLRGDTNKAQNASEFISEWRKIFIEDKE